VLPTIRFPLGCVEVVMRRLLVPVALAALALSPAAAGAAHQAHAKVLVRATTAGTALVDARGHALYLFTVDAKTRSACYGTCAAAWPPFLTAGRPVAGKGVKPSLLGTTKRKDGKLQVTYAGHPLYFFAQDAKAGEAGGEGVNDSWYLVAPSGKRIVKAAAVTTTMSGGGYGGRYGP
jgi:predicted lipoprotein with Yx(FWY)xxD motif